MKYSSILWRNLCWLTGLLLDCGTSVLHPTFRQVPFLTLVDTTADTMVDTMVGTMVDAVVGTMVDTMADFCNV